MALGEFGAPGVLLDGSLTLNVGWKEGGTDLLGRYRTFETEGFIVPQFASADPAVATNAVLKDSNRSLHESALRNRGVVIQGVRQDDSAVVEMASNVWAVLEDRLIDGEARSVIVIQFDGPTELTAIDIKSPSGSLLPSDSGQIEPFSLNLSNTRRNYSVGASLGRLVTIDDEFVTGVGYTGDGSDLSFGYGDTDFTIQPFGFRRPGDLVSFDPTSGGADDDPVEPDNSLNASPEDSRQPAPRAPQVKVDPTPVTHVWAVLEDRLIEGQSRPVFVIKVEEPTGFAAIDIKSAGGFLVPADSEQIEPFSEDLSNTPGNYSVGAEPGTVVTIEDEFVTGVGYAVDMADVADLQFGIGDSDFTFRLFSLRG